MKPIFKTGTFLTARNLNLAQKASGLDGIVEGCDVYLNASDTNFICINKGLVKLPDGILVEFDGNELIDISKLANNTYYVCVIEYSDYSIDYDIVSTIPEYSNIVLAIVNKNGNDLTIENSAKSSTYYSEQHYNIDYLAYYLKKAGTAVGSNVDTNPTYGIKYLNVTASGPALASEEYEVAFISNSSVNKIRIRGELENSSCIYAELYVNGSKVGVSSTITQTTISIDEGHSIAVPFGTIKENDKCKLVLTLYNNESNTATSNIYEIILN